MKVKKIPSKVVTTKKPLHGGHGGWDAKARICCCGNYEFGTQGHEAENRAEVTSTFELRSMLALCATQKSWAIGALGIKTALLHAVVR